MKLGIIIQARLGSTRLPNKIILEFNKNRSVLDIIIDKIKSRFNEYPIILATGDNEINRDLSDLTKKYGIDFFIGSENNVLHRFIEAAESQELTHIIRVCSDNPFLSMDLLDLLISSSDINKFDYISFKNTSGTPVIKTHTGLFAEIVSLDSLKIADSILKNDSEYREHVTNYIYGNPEIFKINLIDSPPEISSRSDIRLTLDTNSDFCLLSEIYDKTEKMSIRELIRFLDDNNNQYIDRMLINIKNNNK